MQAIGLNRAEALFRRGAPTSKSPRLTLRSYLVFEITSDPELFEQGRRFVLDGLNLQRRISTCKQCFHRMSEGLRFGYRSPMPSSGGSRGGSVQSVDRAVSILQVLAMHGTAGVTEIAEELGIHKSTVFRLLATLESRGLVEQDSDRGRYRLGYTVVQLAAGATKMHDLSLLSRPICHELATTVGETVNVAIHDGHAVISIDQVLGSSAITSIDWVGQRTPMHATSAGKVFLANMPDDLLDAILTKGLDRYTPHTMVDPTILKEQLAPVRGQGYAYVIEEHEIGLAAVAAPIRSMDGSVVAAVTVSGPTFRVNEDTIPKLAEHVTAAGAEISCRNGYLKRG